MPKIAIFMNSFAGGGMERAMLNLASFFVAEGASVDLLVASAKGPLLEEIPATVNLIDLGESKSLSGSVRYWLLKSAFTIEPWFFALCFARKLPKAIKVIPGLIAYLNKYSPDAVISTPTTANLSLLWAKSCSSQDVKIVVREASTLSEEVRNKKTIFFRLIKNFVKKWYNKSNTVVCVSDGVKHDLCANFHVQASKLQTIYNILDIERIKRLSKKKDNEQLISELGKFVLSIGRLEEEKDFAALLYAFHQISNDVSHNLVILGEGSERCKLENLAEELSIKHRVFMPGFLVNPYPFIKRCKVFALSSRWEGCPNVLREALVLQKSVISTDCPSGAKEILDNGKLGVLIPIGCVEQYSRELKTLIQEDCDVQNVIADNMNQVSIDLYRKIFFTSKSR